MAQTDMNVADQSGENFLVDINNHLEAIATTHSGTSRPSTVFPGQCWIKTDYGSNTWGYYLYDGTQDVLLGEINTSTHVFTAPNATDAATLNGQNPSFYNDVPNGTRTVFYQASAPTGYTQVTSVNDRMLRVVDGTGGGTGGGWTITGINIQGHQLSISEIPNRTGDFDIYPSNANQDQIRGESGVFSQGSSRPSRGEASEFTSSTYNNYTVEFSLGGGGGSHSHGVDHDGNWRPAYADVIVCERSK